MKKYQITINFTTDRELTPEEQFQIVAAAQVQVRGLLDAEGEDMTVEVSEVNSHISKS
jgi:hypothetical protein